MIHLGLAFGLLLALLLPGSLSLAATSDYLPPDLRTRVEQLKADLDTIATTQTNARARAELTWAWLNAYALDGGYLPVNATLVVARVLADGDIRAPLTRALNETIAELTMLDDHPDAIGPLQADPGPFTAGAQATITQTYTVGEQSIQTGGGIMVARHFMANFGAWQTNDPSAAGYVSVATSNPRVSFVATTTQMTGMHGGFRNTRPTLVFKVASGTLEQGDTVTLVYGDTRAGGPGLTMPSFASDRMPLPLYIAFADDGQYFSLPIQPIRIVGAQAHGVAGFAPSVIKPGEDFTLSIRAQDRYFNRATSGVPNWVLAMNGAPWMEVNASGAITLTETSIAEPGVYFISISSSDGAIRGQANPILVTDEQRDRIYWGDTHGHSGFAEGIGTPEGFMQWARDDARLDYVTHSEHDVWLDDAEWEELRENVREFSDEGTFAPFLGYEWSVNTTRGGHHNVLFRSPDNVDRVPAQFYPTLTALYHGLRQAADPRDIVVIPHAHQAGDYRTNDPELEPLVEIMSQHGNFEWFGRMYLQHGHQVGFTAASDNHLSQPGYSAPIGGSLSQRGGLGAVLAPSSGSDAIFDAMKQLKAYATTGARIILDFDVNGTGMGQRGAFSDTRQVRASVIGTAPIDSVSLIKNDQVIWQQAYADDASEGRDQTLLLSFSSASHPHHSHDNPRGWRSWEGTLEVENGTLTRIEPVDASMPTQSAAPSSQSPNRVTFATKSRGDASSFLLHISGAQRTTRLNIDLIETPETGGAPPVYRPHTRVPATSFAFTLRDMDNGQITHTQHVDDYEDRVVLRKVITDGPRQVDIEFTDTGHKHGDYYYLRVVQTNDAMAWSSPVWIGGHNKR